MATIKIGDLLDLSSPLAASISPDAVLPRLAGTVHHRPADYTPEDVGERRRWERKSSSQVTRIKVERDEEEKCPNVLVQNGVICTPYRARKEDGGIDDHQQGGSRRRKRREERVRDGREGEKEGRSDERLGERVEGSETTCEGTEQETGSSVLSSPHLDPLSFQNLTTKQLLKRLFLTRKLLALKKLSLKDKAMAVNLETLLPEAFSLTTPPVVPCNNGTAEESQFSDLFSPSSMYGSNGLSLLVAGGSNSLDFDPALVKSDFLSLDGGSPTVGEALYQTDTSDPFSEWLATPMTLPITPDEPLPDNMATSLPPVSCYDSAPTYTAMQAFPNHHAPSPSIPLTPESLVFPESFCSSDEVDEVLSCLSSDSTPLDANDAYNVFPCPTDTHLYNDSYPSSLYSSPPMSPYSSYSSSPIATPLTGTPSPQPPTSLTLHLVSPSDTIRNLLARDQPHTTMSDTTPLLGGSVAGSVAAPLSSQPQIQRTNLQKRKCRASESVLGAPPSKKPSKGGRRIRRVSTGTKKERKREQNKTAALRYRQKKKLETVDYNQQQGELEERNAALRATLGSIEAEIAYLTRFWSEVQAKQHVGY